MDINLTAGAAYRAFCAVAQTHEAEQLMRCAAAEAAQAASGQTLKALGQLPADAPDDAIFEAIHAVRMTGELPYWLSKAAACLFANNKDLDGQGLRDAIRDRGGLLREPDAVQLIYKQCIDMRSGSIMEDVRRVNVLKEAYRDGYHYEKVCRGCAQCTIAALFGVTGKREEHLFRAANGFAAGMGLFGDGVCGGYSGGLLYMGTYAGRRFEFFDADKAEKDLSMHMADKLHSRFIETYGSVICHDIHRDIFGRAFYIREADQKEAFEKSGAHTADKCTAVVATASMWTAEILMEEGFLDYKKGGTPSITTCEGE